MVVAVSSMCARFVAWSLLDVNSRLSAREMCRWNMATEKDRIQKAVSQLPKRMLKKEGEGPPESSQTQP
jgi:hypothetical protein